jgi:hypothetical protein
VAVDGGLVEGVELGGLGGASVGADRLGECIEPLCRAPGEVTRAPSRAKALATALPIGPPAP